MDNLIAKSEENNQSADILIKHKKYASSVHCAYYSAFQFMLYVQNKLESKVVKQSGSKKSSHVTLSNYIAKLIKEKADAEKFNKIFRKIKRNRISADYKYCLIS